jgi:hypothetical protein
MLTGRSDHSLLHDWGGFAMLAFTRLPELWSC